MSRFVVVAIPTIDGKVQARMIGDMLMAARDLSQHGINFGYLFLENCSLIHKARNRLAAQFLLMPEATDLLFIDADMGFDGAGLVKLVLESESHDVVGGLYASRGAKTSYIATPETSSDGKLVYNTDGLLRMERIPTGFMLVRRRTLEKLAESLEDQAWSENGGKVYPFFTLPMTVENGEVGEDFSFCDLVRRNGMTVLAHPDITLFHYGTAAVKCNFRADVLSRGNVLEELTK